MPHSFSNVCMFPVPKNVDKAVVIIMRRCCVRVIQTHNNALILHDYNEDGLYIKKK